MSAQADDPSTPTQQPGKVALVGKSGTVGSVAIIVVEGLRLWWASAIGDQPLPAEMPDLITSNLLIAVSSIFMWIFGPKGDKG